MVRECLALGILPSSSIGRLSGESLSTFVAPCRTPSGRVHGGRPRFSAEAPARDRSRNRDILPPSHPAPPPHLAKLLLRIDLANETVQKIQSLNRRSLDPIAARVWFALERAYELGGELSDARPYGTFGLPAFPR